MGYESTNREVLAVEIADAYLHEMQTKAQCPWCEEIGTHHVCCLLVEYEKLVNDEED